MAQYAIMLFTEAPPIPGSPPRQAEPATQQGGGVEVRPVISSTES